MNLTCQKILVLAFPCVGQQNARMCKENKARKRTIDNHEQNWKYNISNHHPLDLRPFKRLFAKL